MILLLYSTAGKYDTIINKFTLSKTLANFMEPICREIFDIRGFNLEFLFILFRIVKLKFNFGVSFEFSSTDLLCIDLKNFVSL